MDAVIASADASPNQDAEGAQLRAEVELAPQWGEGSEVEDTQPDESKEKDSPKAQSDTGADTADTPKLDAQGDAAGKDIAKPDSSESSADTEVLQAEGESDSSYQKRVKERDRYAVNWKKFDEEKAAFRQEAAQLRAEQQAMKEQLARAFQQQQQGPPSQAPTPQECLKAAKGFEQKAQQAYGEGDVENGQKFLNMASQARDLANRTYFQGQQAQVQQQQAQYDHAWQSNMQAELDKWPELADPNSKESKAMAALLDPKFSGGAFDVSSDGFSRAVQVLKWQMAAENSELRGKELEEAKQKLQELEQRTQIKGGGVSSKSDTTDFDKMDAAQQRAFLRRGAQGDDSAAWGM